MELKDKPTAICCVNDVCANFIIEAFKEKGINVPQDLSVTGFDDTGLSKRLELTTACQDYGTMGSCALEKLISLFKYSSDNKDILVPVKIIERKSVKDLNII
jgi:Transcriptional regulators